jgi:hypothetical protein
VRAAADLERAQPRQPRREFGEPLVAQLDGVFAAWQ